MAVWSQVKKSRGCELSLRPIGCTPALAVTQQRRNSCICRLWRYMSVMPLPLAFIISIIISLLIQTAERNHGNRQIKVINVFEKQSVLLKSQRSDYKE